MGVIILEVSADKFKYLKIKYKVMFSNTYNSVTSMTRSKQKAATAALSINEMHEMMESCQRLLNCHGLQAQSSCSDA